MSDNSKPSTLSYASSGVDVEAGDRAVELMKSSVAKTQGAEVLSGAGGFAGLWDASALTKYKKPLLASSTDGVGTKVAIAQAMDIHHTIGHDLVGMVVDDIAVCGAKPLFMTDYIACGSVVPQRIADIVRGIAEGCELAGTALVGGETAEHPGLLQPDEYDVAGAAVGVVEADELLGPDRVREGNVLVAMASSGIHSNGYSLVRKIVKHLNWTWEQEIPEFGQSLGQELLTPTRIYAKLCLDLASRVSTFSHITGGGLAANLARVLPEGLIGLVDRSTWHPAPVFGVLAGAADVSRDDMEIAFNMGVGMVAVVPAEHVDSVVRDCGDAGVDAWVCGEVAAFDPARHIDAVSGTKGLVAGAALVQGDYHQ